jgi:hypothetical protein
LQTPFLKLPSMSLISIHHHHLLVKYITSWAWWWIKVELIESKFMNGFCNRFKKMSGPKGWLSVTGRRTHEIFLNLHDGIFGWLLMNHHDGYESIQWE